MTTLLTFEEWWAYEGKRRRERPYSPVTHLHFKDPICARHQQVTCQECPGETFMEKGILSRIPHSYGTLEQGGDGQHLPAPQKDGR